ncbi:hypothetical protein H4219_002838 [Mycoemilia scoparia]|uniref:Uncharacterized protein n=1 Tax=Mycoemilia scoparia TaxID=417184 RepID=A0A9W7ZWH5_9FUNG|nr:hypothetical protein H4219_002838 [Mycoemilia scoparia]
MSDPYFLPKRPALGSRGRHTVVTTNAFRVLRQPTGIIHQYDVEVQMFSEKPEHGKPLKKVNIKRIPDIICRNAFRQAIETHKNSELKGIGLIYDGNKIAYSTKEIPFKENTPYLNAVLNNVDQYGGPPGAIYFQICFKYVSIVDMDNIAKYIRGEGNLPVSKITTQISILDILLRQQASFNYYSFGRSFYMSSQKGDLGGGVEAYSGFYQSIRPAEQGLILNLDTTSTAFYKPGYLLNNLLEIVGGNHPNVLTELKPKDVAQINGYLKGLSVTTKVGDNFIGYFKLKGIVPDSASKHTFDWKGHDGNQPSRRISVQEYFKIRYNVSLRFPHLPLVECTNRGKVPLELCTIPEGQRCARKLSNLQVRDMIKFTCLKPETRTKRILHGYQQMNYSNNPDMRQFKLEIDRDMMAVQGRVLEPPTLKYHASSYRPNIVPSTGVWNLKNMKVINGATLKDWGIIVFEGPRYCPEQMVQGFVRTLVSTCNDTGMVMSNRAPLIHYGQSFQVKRTMDEFLNIFNRTNNRDPQLILCILPTMSSNTYGEIKCLGDTYYGIRTQCMQKKFLRNPSRQYCANLCLKMNIKLGGISSEIEKKDLYDLTTVPTMMLGLDVFHAGPQDAGKPSMGALVASMDLLGTRYRAIALQQPPRAEIIQGLEESVYDHLKSFRNSTGALPQRVIMYRDGVSEGQFEQVANQEVPAIKRACQSFNKSYNPKVTVVVVLKRHHIRMFPTKPNEADRSGNCQAGTVIDQGITNSQYYDFYLQSHAGIQGTSSPTHYFVIYDESKFHPDHIQGLTYNMCYNYMICTRSVSIVPPVYYAHKLANRAKFYVQKTSSDDRRKRAPAKLIPVHRDIQESMFFM